MIKDDSSEKGHFILNLVEVRSTISWYSRWYGMSHWYKCKCELYPKNALFIHLDGQHRVYIYPTSIRVWIELINHFIVVIHPPQSKDWFQKEDSWRLLCDDERFFIERNECVCVEEYLWSFSYKLPSTKQSSEANVVERRGKLISFLSLISYNLWAGNRKERKRQTRGLWVLPPSILLHNRSSQYYFRSDCMKQRTGNVLFQDVVTVTWSHLFDHL